MACAKNTQCLQGLQKWSVIWYITIYTDRNCGVKKTMKQKDITIHRAIASSMTAIEVFSMIKDLEQERSELASFLSQQEIQKYHTIISIYMEELEFISFLNSQNHSNLAH